MKTQEEVKKFRAFIKTEVYPFLLEHSENVEEAKQMCGVLNMTIRQAMMNQEKKFLVSQLDIPEVTDKYEKYNQFIKLFLDKPVFDATQLLQGLADTIDSFIREENTKKQLSELKAELLD